VVEPVTHTEVEVPYPGIRAWTNPRTGARVVEVHYSADPTKDEEWAANERRKYDSMGWRREYEIDWTALLGKPVYGEEWNDDIHVLGERFAPDPSLPLLCGWDFATNPSIVVAQYIREGRLIAFSELQSDYIFGSFLGDALLWRNAEWPNYQWYDFCDPSGTAKSQTDGLLSTLRKGKPVFQLDPWGCPILHRGFGGGYCYESVETSIGARWKEKPAKNEDCDMHDALQYLCTKLDVVVVPTPDENRPLSKAWRF
jgi:hypothetical protein